MGSILPLYTSPLSPPLSLSPIDSLSPYPIISQNELHAIICQQQEQLAAMQVQIQALLVAAGGREGEAGIGNIEVAKSQLFNGIPSKVAGFMTGCKLYIRNKLAGVMVEA